VYKNQVKIKEYEATLTQPLRQATNAFLLRDNQILLALKKRGFGVGKWNGVGGKLNPGEDIRSAAIREAEEEICVNLHKPKKVAIINFYFPLVPKEKNWDLQVTVFICKEWQGEPQETEEMAPQWFNCDQIPYHQMWWDDEIWLSKVLSGSFIVASFMFGEDEKVIDHYLEEVENLD